MGLILRGTILKKHNKQPFVALFVLLVIFEIVEGFVYLNPETFNNFIPIPESSLDVLWDLILGMFGGLLKRKSL